MTKLADTGVFDNLQEKLSNPAFFTYCWVFCFWNWKAIFFLFDEPLKFTIKLKDPLLTFEFWQPLAIAGMSLVILPWINSFVEIFKHRARFWLQNWLHEKKIVLMITPVDHEKLKKEYVAVKSSLTLAQEAEINSKEKLDEFKEKYTELLDNFNKTKISLTNEIDLKNESINQHSQLINQNDALRERYDELIKLKPRRPYKRKEKQPEEQNEFPHKRAEVQLELDMI